MNSHRGVVLLVHFDGFVSLGCNQAALRVIENAGENPRLTVQRTRLHSCMDPLKIITSSPVPHVDRTVVRFERKLV